MEITLSNIVYDNIKNLNICFFNSKVTTVVGANGSGKSSLLQLLSMHKIPMHGNIIVDKKIVNFANNSAYNISQKIGIVSQNIENYIFHNTVEEYLLYLLESTRFNDKEKRIVDSLSMVGLPSKYLKRKLKSLSNGEKFLIAFSGVLALNSKVIILDDPTCFLDYKNKNLLSKLLKIMKSKYKKTIIIMSNDMDFVYSVSDYVYIMAKSKIVLHGNKYDVFKNKKLEKYKVLKPNIIKFTSLVKEKTNINLPDRDNINDLIKDIYFYVEQKNRGVL